MHIMNQQGKNTSDPQALQALTQQLSQLSVVVSQFQETLNGLSLPLSTSTSDHEFQGLAPPGYQTQQEILEARVQELELVITKLTSSHEPPFPIRAVGAPLKSEKQPSQQPQQQQQQPLFYDDVDSPYRALLRAKIDYVKKELFKFEPNRVPMPPPDNLGPISDEVYVTWCACGGNVGWYQRKLFRLIEKLQAKEETERKALRDKHKRVYENDESPHRKHLAAKIAAVKLAIQTSFPLKRSGKKALDMPLDPDEVEIELFLVWCLHSKDYSGCRRDNRYERCEWLNYQYYDTYEMELGSVIESLLARDEEERLYLVKVRESNSE
ncbi:hypothetical protein BGX26_007214 [Mortierella sp. AD094]|nr:hypothetical protein BGX26_007214 [Mortierella sp. AD094]